MNLHLRKFTQSEKGIVSIFPWPLFYGFMSIDYRYALGVSHATLYDVEFVPIARKLSQLNERSD